MSTGENEQGLRKIIDLTRWISMIILLTHFYIFCYAAFKSWGWTAGIVDKIVMKIGRLSIFETPLFAKLTALLLLIVFLAGIKGKKDEKINLKMTLAYLITGLLLYFISQLFLFTSGGYKLIAAGYIIVTCVGYLLILSGGTFLSRILKIKMKKDIFNKLNESFPQEERLLGNEFSLNFPARYNLKGKIHQSWINIINPFRGLLVAGTPGAGKTYFVIRNAIIQQIRKGYSMFLYDFKYDDLSKIAYNALLKYQNNYKIPPSFYVINFDKPMHRCNPLEPEAMTDITDATESARTILLGLNRNWIKKQGEFFSLITAYDAAICFFTRSGFWL